MLIIKIYLLIESVHLSYEGKLNDMKYTSIIFGLEIFFVIVFIFIVQNARAQVIIQLRQQQLYQFKVEDIWRVTLENTTVEPINIYLEGYAEEENEDSFFEKVRVKTIIIDYTEINKK